MRGVVYLPPNACDRSCPAVVQNLGSYSALQAIQGEAPLFATRGYAYLLAWNEGSKEEVADRVFERWAADADAILEWLGQQPWCASGMCQPPLAVATCSTPLPPCGSGLQCHTTRHDMPTARTLGAMAASSPTAQASWARPALLSCRRRRETSPPVTHSRADPPFALPCPLSLSLVFIRLSFLVGTVRDDSKMLPSTESPCGGD